MQTKSEKFLSKSVQNSVDKCKNKCHSLYYIVKLKVDDLIFSENEDIIKKFLVDKNNIPLIIFTKENYLFLVFPKTNFMKMYYHKIISYYINFFHGICKKNVTCSITEFQTKIQLLIFFAVKIKNMKNKYLSEKLNIDTSLLTEREINKTADQKNIQFTQENLYGKFFKLKKKNKKFIIKVTSENINLEETKKYIDFIFS